MEEWQSSVAVIDETVRAVKTFLKTSILSDDKIATQITINQVSNFF